MTDRATGRATRADHPPVDPASVEPASVDDEPVDPASVDPASVDHEPVETAVTDDVEAAAEALARGRLVAFPTETVYGLGADASDGRAVARIFTAKGRPAGHPLIVHLGPGADLDAWAVLEGPTAAQAHRLAEAFWPGPLTLVVPRSDRVAPETVGGRSTVGLRVPDHPTALALLEAFGAGVAAPSANRFGRVSPTTVDHVLADLGGRVDVILTGADVRVGVESTIVELGPTGPQLLRPGAVTADEVAAVLGRPVDDGRRGEARASGMLASHYAPDAVVELVTGPSVTGPDLAQRAAAAGPGVGVIAPFAVDHRPSWVLPADAEGYGRELYRALRRADRAGVERLLVVPPRDGPLFEAVMDRLAKAAAPRPSP